MTDSVKRRLVYVADDDETMLNELSTTPPTRPSRMSQLHISSSNSTARQGGSQGGRAGNEEARDSRTLPAASLVDPLLLLSYDGFLLADGSGTLRTPRTVAEAYRMLAALKDCHDFLRGAVHLDTVKQLSDIDWSSTSSSTTSSSSDSSSTYTATNDELALSDAADDTDDDDEPATRRRARRRRCNGVSCNAEAGVMTVAQLRHQLRQHNLPVTGTKQVLQQRLQLYLESTQTSFAPVPHDEAHTGEKENAPPASCAPQTTAPAALVEDLASCGHHMLDHTSPTSHEAHDDTSVPQTDSCRSSPKQDGHVPPPPPRTSEEPAPSRRSLSGRASHGLWEALVNVGTRFFGQQGGWHSAQRDGHSASPLTAATGSATPHELTTSSATTPASGVTYKHPRDE